jgi:hypothetical protein
MDPNITDASNMSYPYMVYSKASTKRPIQALTAGVSGGGQSVRGRKGFRVKKEKLFQLNGIEKIIAK